MSTEDTLPDSSTVEGRKVSHEASTDGITLLEGEKMLKNLRPSWEAWWWQLILGSLLVLMMLASGNIVFGALGLSTLGYVAIARYWSRYFITDERVIQRTGILRRSTNEVRIDDIENLRTDAKILERILGHGHIVASSASATGIVSFFALPDYKQVANIVREQQRG